MATRKAQVQTAILAAFLAAGAGVVWAAGVGIVYLVVAALFPVTEEVREQLYVLPDGRPAIARPEKGDVVFRTLDGKPAKPPYWPGVAPAALKEDLREPELQALDWQSRLVYLSRYWRKGFFWFFVHDGDSPGRGYILGSDIETKRATAYVGTKGFRSDKPPYEEQFRMDVRNLKKYETYQNRFLFLVTEDGLVLVDFEQRMVRCLGKVPDVISAQESRRDPLIRDPYQEAVPDLLLVRTPDHVVSIDFEGREVERWVIPPGLRGAPLSWQRLPNRQSLVRTTNLQGRLGNELFWIEPTGKVVRHLQVDLAVIKPDHRPWTTRLAQKMAQLLAVPSAPVLGLILAGDPWDFEASGRSRPRSLPYPLALAGAWRDYRWSIEVNLVLAAVLSVCCYRRHRGHGLPAAGGWALFVLIFGVPAYLGYLAHRKWPERLPCPSCQQPVPRDRPGCLACGKEFPQPALTGVEVFA